MLFPNFQTGIPAYTGINWWRHVGRLMFVPTFSLYLSYIGLVINKDGKRETSFAVPCPGQVIYHERQRLRYQYKYMI